LPLLRDGGLNQKARSEGDEEKNAKSEQGRFKRHPPRPFLGRVMMAPFVVGDEIGDEGREEAEDAADREG
jgi:hypothetical protein